MIEVIFLGTGAALPMRNQTNTSYLIKVGNERILIDCGPAILQQLDAIGMSPGEITHVFFTHRHGDHILGYPMLMLWYEITPLAGVGAPCLIASALTFSALDTLMDVAYGPLSGVSESAARMVLDQDAPDQAHIHPTIMLRTLPMMHSTFAPVLGVRIETRSQLGTHTIAITGDTGPNPNIVTLAKDADLLIHEAAYSATLNPEFSAGAYGHSTAQIAGRNAQAAQVKQLALVHIDGRYESQVKALLDEAQREYAGKVFAPVAGLVITLP